MTWPSQKMWSWSQTRASSEAQLGQGKALGQLVCCSLWMGGCTVVLDQGSLHLSSSSSSSIHSCSGQPKWEKKHAGNFMEVFDWIRMTLTSDEVPGLSLTFEVKSRYLVLGCGQLLQSWQRAGRPLRRQLTVLGGWAGKGKLWCNPARCEKQRYQIGKI